MNEDRLSRRAAVRRLLLVAVSAPAALALACSKKDGAAALSCTDTSGLAPADTQLRTTLGYVDKSTAEGKACSGCQLYKPAPSEGVCGGCTLVKGPINPGGYCTSWVKKNA